MACFFFRCYVVSMFCRSIHSGARLCIRTGKTNKRKKTLSSCSKSIANSDRCRWPYVLTSGQNRRKILFLVPVPEFLVSFVKSARATLTHQTSQTTGLQNNICGLGEKNGHVVYSGLDAFLTAIDTRESACIATCYCRAGDWAVNSWH